MWLHMDEKQHKVSDRTSEIAERLTEVRAQIPKEAKLIVVTKTFPMSDVEILYGLGQRDFAENRDVEGAEKSKGLPDDAKWHFQGAIQSNKLKSIVNWCDYIHSLDSLEHAQKISQLALQLDKQINCFVQINLDRFTKVAQSTNRSGVNPLDLESFISGLEGLSGIKVVGVMGVGPLNAEPGPAFELLKKCSEQLQKSFPEARSISAGMSGDYLEALKHGATHIRLGSSILGTR